MSGRVVDPFEVFFLDYGHVGRVQVPERRMAAAR
jgi:hypothetical protein